MRTIAAMSILLLASQATAISIVMPAPDIDPILAQQIFEADVIGPDPTLAPWVFSLEYGDTLVGEKGSYLNETSIAVAGGMITVGFNNTGLRTNNVSWTTSVDKGQTWVPQYALFIRNPFIGSLKYSSDPGVASCKTRRGKTRTLVSWVAFGDDFLMGDAFGQHYNCNANNAFCITGSTDAGHSWDIVHSVSEGGGVFRDRPMIACDPSSPNCWAMYNGYPPELGTGYCDEEASRLFVQYSSDCGDHWTWPVAIAGTHMAPTNLAVLHDGRVRFAMFTDQATMKIYECDTYKRCKILAISGPAGDFIAAGSDHSHVQGLSDTRLNSMPVIGCDPYGHKCTVAYMVERGNYHNAIYRASIAYRTSVDDGLTWTHSALAPALNSLEPDQILPMIDWGVTTPGLCFYQRQGLTGNAGDHTFQVTCYNSPDYGVTWNPQPVLVGAPIEMSTVDTLAVQSFLGDYNMFDGLGGWMAITNLIPPGATASNVSTKPVIEVIPYKPDPGCQVDPSTPFSLWSLLLPLVLLFRVWVTPVQAECMGDCNGDGEVQVNELVQNVLILLEEKDPNECLNPVDLCEDVDVVCMVQAVNNSLEGCE